MYFIKLGKRPLSHYLNHFENDKLMERFKNLNPPLTKMLYFCTAESAKLKFVYDIGFKMARAGLHGGGGGERKAINSSPP